MKFMFVSHSMKTKSSQWDGAIWKMHSSVPISLLRQKNPLSDMLIPTRAEPSPWFSALHDRVCTWRFNFFQRKDARIKFSYMEVVETHNHTEVHFYIILTKILFLFLSRWIPLGVEFDLWECELVSSPTSSPCLHCQVESKFWHQWRVTVKGEKVVQPTVYGRDLC